MYQSILREQLELLKSSNQYRTFTTLSRICGQYPLATLNGERQEQVVVWCSNNYLGMSPQGKRQRASEAAEQHRAAARAVEAARHSGHALFPDSRASSPCGRGRALQSGCPATSAHPRCVSPTNQLPVRAGTERFRVNATPNHSQAQIDHLALSIRETFEHFAIPLASQAFASEVA